MIGFVIAPVINTEYAAFTNFTFLLKETIQIARCFLENKSIQGITDLIIHENFLDRRSIDSRKTIARVLLYRLSDAPSELLEFLDSSHPNLPKYTNLYLILAKHRLLREFIEGVLVHQLQHMLKTLSPSDIHVFFEQKRLEPPLSQWSEQTFEKSRNNILRICLEAGLLRKSSNTFEIVSSRVPQALKEYLVIIGYERFLALMLDGDL